MFQKQNLMKIKLNGERLYPADAFSVRYLGVKTDNIN